MTVVLDRPNWLSRDDVRALDAAGMTIASHTWDHHPVTEYGEKDWATQLVKPREQLEQIVGHEVDLFAYPYGLWNHAALPHVQAAGYRAAFQLTGSRRTPSCPLLTVRRVLTLPTWDVPTLLARVSRDHPAGSSAAGREVGYRSTCRHGERATVRRRHLSVTVPRPPGRRRTVVESAPQSVTVRLRSFSPVDG